MDKAKEIVTIQAVGRASAGFLGNPGNGLLILGTVLGVVGGIVGLDGAEVISRFFSTLQGLHAAEPDTEEQRDAANAFISAQRALIEFFAPFLAGFLPGGPGPGVPGAIAREPTPEELAVQEEKIRRKGEIGL